MPDSERARGAPRPVAAAARLARIRQRAARHAEVVKGSVCGVSWQSPVGWSGPNVRRRASRPSRLSLREPRQMARICQPKGDGIVRLHATQEPIVRHASTDQLDRIRARARIHEDEIRGLRPRRSRGPYWLERARGVDRGEPTSFVYFIHRADTREVKIGFTVDLEKRLATLQQSHGAPLVLLHATRGGMKLERVVHRRFAALRKLGEWFEATPELLAWIEAEYAREYERDA